MFQEETRGRGVCLAFVETLQRERIVSDARRAALTIQASTARVILIFSWYTDVRKLFLQLSKINVRKEKTCTVHLNELNEIWDFFFLILIMVYSL